MAAANYTANVPKLKGRDNYDEWVFAAENVLILEGMMKCIKESVESVDDAKTKVKLIMTIDPSFCMTSYVTQIIETGQKLNGTGFAINNVWIGSLLLAGLPEKYAPMIMAIEHSGIQLNRHSPLRKVATPKEVYAHEEPKWRTDERSEENCQMLQVQKHWTLSITMSVYFLFLSGSFNEEDWYVNSGASVHLTANKNRLWNVSEETNQEILVANKTTVPVQCSGNIRIVTLAGGSEYDVNIEKPEPEMLNLKKEKVEENEVSVGDDPLTHNMDQGKNESCTPTTSEFGDAEDHEESLEEEKVIESRPVRDKHPPARYGFGGACFSQYDTAELSLKEAIQGPEREQWLQAVKEELLSYEENSAWELVDLPRDGSIVHSLLDFSE
ncbi:hypothetical protein ILUMI_11045 [Ignelater luminosus]|uniref:Retrovirus-related Pol polyprotein from transposon TNT 1-94-like beta-barrel domain-containing protein n=1 Tax=Ignelater luminosus TaxID=2038154 RepID=A0A8K0CZ74_IGNLU|nr:hypothetical protein ILUMI_11045 [Ignelater luminosus]